MSEPSLTGLLVSAIVLSRARCYYCLLSMSISVQNSQQLTSELCSPGESATGHFIGERCVQQVTGVLRFDFLTPRRCYSARLCSPWLARR